VLKHSSIARVVEGLHSFCLHTHAFTHQRNKPYLPLPSQPKLVLIYRSRRDGRLSWPSNVLSVVERDTAVQVDRTWESRHAPRHGDRYIFDLSEQAVPWDVRTGLSICRRPASLDWDHQKCHFQVLSTRYLLHFIIDMYTGHQKTSTCLYNRSFYKRWQISIIFGTQYTEIICNTSGNI